MSKYAELMDGIPLSGFAISGYLVILILSLYGFSEAHRNHVRKLLLFFSGVAVLFSLAYLIIMVGTIGKFCLLCLGVDVINLAIFGISFLLEEQKEGYVPVLFRPKMYYINDMEHSYLNFNERGEIRAENNDKIDDETIVEFRFDMGEKQWKPIRVREDKTKIYKKGIFTKTANSLVF
jgi:hypothetical protein